MTSQEATKAVASATTATEEDNQAQMRSRLSKKTCKRPDTPVDEEGASKKLGVRSHPNNGMGMRPAYEIMYSILTHKRDPELPHPLT